MITDYYAVTEAAEIELTGGQWVRRGLTMVWESREPLRIVDDRLAALREIAGDYIACVTCRARVSQSCRTVSGHTTTAHQSRLTLRLCPCGATLTGRRRYCDPCRDESTRVSKHGWYLRQVASGRRGAAA